MLKQYFKENNWDCEDKFVIQCGDTYKGFEEMVQNKTKHEIVNFVSEIAGNRLDLMLNISTLFSTYS